MNERDKLASQPLSGDADLLRQKADALVKKLREVHKHSAFLTSWLAAHIHAGPYDGPTYGVELDELEAALSTLHVLPGSAQELGPRKTWGKCGHCNGTEFTVTESCDTCGESEVLEHLVGEAPPVSSARSPEEKP